MLAQHRPIVGWEAGLHIKLCKTELLCSPMPETTHFWQCSAGTLDGSTATLEGDNGAPGNNTWSARITMKDPGSDFSPGSAPRGSRTTWAAPGRWSSSPLIARDRRLVCLRSRFKGSYRCLRNWKLCDSIAQACCPFWHDLQESLHNSTFNTQCHPSARHLWTLRLQCSCPCASPEEWSVMWPTISCLEHWCVSTLLEGL
jgi:hypothetical protein